jgi:hypothetical protein
MSMQRELEEARDRVAQLEQAIKHGKCSETGHNWEHIGGANAACCDTCNCSIPVYQCSKCGDCDYGDNPEADTHKKRCAEGDHQ